MKKLILITLAKCLLLTNLLTTASAGGFVEDFTNNPLLNGWRVFGDTNLFKWDEQSKNLSVIWDSSRSNSYFMKPIGAILNRDYEFTLAFDLILHQVSVGTTPGKPFTFELAIGLINYTNATSPDFLRGTGFNSPNLVEFDYFPDSGFGATISPTIISSNNEWATSFNFPIELYTNTLYRVTMTYNPATLSLSTTILSNGYPFTVIQDAVLGTNFSNFFVDYLAICSYSDEGQDPLWGGSIRATGSVDNISISWSHPAAARLALSRAGSSYQIKINSSIQWWYTLERTTDFANWIKISPPMPGTGSELIFVDDNPPSDFAFYRVLSEKL